jgi:hypothetical protein
MIKDLSFTTEHPKAVEIIPFEDRGIWRASPPGRRRCSRRSPKASERAFFGQVQADAEDPLELFRYRWYNYVSTRQDDCEKQMFDPAVSGISDGNEPMRDGLLAKCNAFDGAVVRPLMKAQHPWRVLLFPHGLMRPRLIGMLDLKHQNVLEFSAVWRGEFVSKQLNSRCVDYQYEADQNRYEQTTHIKK